MSEQNAHQTTDTQGSDTSVEAANTQGANKVKKTRKRLIIAGVIFLIIALLLLLLKLCSSDWFDSDAQSGSLQGLTEAEIMDELNRQVQEGMMNMTMANQIVFENGQAQGAALIQNLPMNRVDQKVTITLDETDEVIYQSKAIAPGQYIEYITLEKPLAAGTYKATALFEGFNQETHKAAGSAALQITLVVET